MPGEEVESPNTRRMLVELFEWAEAANQRLSYEVDRETGMQFGGNPYSNPLFRRVRKQLEFTDPDK